MARKSRTEYMEGNIEMGNAKASSMKNFRLRTSEQVLTIPTLMLNVSNNRALPSGSMSEHIPMCLRFPFEQKHVCPSGGGGICS